MFESYDQRWIKDRPQAPGLFVEQERPPGIVIDDLDFIHVVGSMTQSVKTSSSDKRSS
jgi:hypothetical protein